MSEPAPYTAQQIKRERLKALAARRGAGGSKDGSLILSVPTARDDIAAAPIPPPTAPGETVSGEGVYIGKWEARDARGNSLGKIFNLYAAPEDLASEGGKLQMFFNDAVQRLDSLRDWHGHDGAVYDHENDINAALQDGSYKGEWIIPTMQMLGSKNIDIESENTLYARRDEKELKGTFKSSGQNPGYWTCTGHDTRDDYRSVTVFNEGTRLSLPSNSALFYLRPVRLVPA